MSLIVIVGVILYYFLTVFQFSLLVSTPGQQTFSQLSIAKL